MIMYFAFLDSFKDIMDLLNDALEKLKSDSMPLWTMAEMYILNLDDSYVCLNNKYLHLRFTPL